MLTLAAFQLCQGIKGRCWEDDKSGRLLQQLKGLGEAMSKKLVSYVPPVLHITYIYTHAFT